MWGEGRRLNPLAQAMAAAQIKKLPAIIGSLQHAQRRIKDGIADIPGLRFRALADPQSDCGSFLVTYWPDGATAFRASEALKAEGVPQWTYHLQDYGSHMYYHMPMLTQKLGWSRGSSWPWNAPENAGSDYCYERGALPRSDAIFARGVVMAVPSVLTDEQCDAIAAAYRKVAHHVLS
jgi:8-amino-3,8-dideoxy-alpha-D-manno-octulosonate transaminase